MNQIKQPDCPHPIAVISERVAQSEEQGSHTGIFRGWPVRFFDIINRLPNPSYYLCRYWPQLLCGGLMLLARTVVAAPARNGLSEGGGVSDGVSPENFIAAEDRAFYPPVLSGCSVAAPVPLPEIDHSLNSKALSSDDHNFNPVCGGISDSDGHQTTMVFMSDSQYPWACFNDHVDCDNQAKATRQNLNHIHSINEIRDCVGEHQFAGTVINGDLTAFGHSWQLRTYRSLYYDAVTGIKGTVYPGLGNHDIENNVNDCWRNQCASGMVHHLLEEVEKINPVSFDLTSWDLGYFSRTYNGSLAYSWDVGKIHFVQLNNYPTYETHWQGFSFASFKTEMFRIQSSLPWLEKDLAAARDRGQHIILNYHNVGVGSPERFSDGRVFFGNRAFLEVLRRYEVSAIFAGHYHELVGEVYPDIDGVQLKYEDFYGEGRHLPLFFGGSVPLQQYVVANFFPGAGKFTVSVVASNKSIGEQVWSKKYYPLR